MKCPALPVEFKKYLQFFSRILKRNQLVLAFLTQGGTQGFTQKKSIDVVHSFGHYIANIYIYKYERRALLHRYSTHQLEFSSLYIKY